MKNKMLVLFMAISGMFLFTHCGKGAKEGGRLKIAGIIFQEDQFFRLVLSGMREQAKAMNVDLLEANSNNKMEKEIELINTYIARKAAAICISPLSQTGSVTALKLAHDNGLKVVCYNTSIFTEAVSANVECSAADLGEQTGKAAREFIQKNLGGKAKIAIVAFKSQVPEQSDARTGGFKKEATQLSGVQIIAEQDGWLAEMAVKKVGDIMTANPDVNIIYAANEGGTIGAVLAVKNAGKAGQVFVFGTDVNEQLLEFLKSSDGILQAITAQQPVEVGRRALEFSVKAAQNNPVEKSLYLSGVCLSRTDLAAVQAYQIQLTEWIKNAGSR